MSFHPEYEKAPRARRWTESLPRLRKRLDQESETTPAERWAWRILPHGAVVAMRKGDGRRFVRISRSQAPPKGREHKWHDELATFREKLLLKGWDEEEEKTEKGVARIYSCPEALLCGCGRRKSDTAMLFGNPDECEHCQIAKVSGRKP